MFLYVSRHPQLLCYGLHCLPGAVRPGIVRAHEVKAYVGKDVRFVLESGSKGSEDNAQGRRHICASPAQINTVDLAIAATEEPVGLRVTANYAKIRLCRA